MKNILKAFPNLLQGQTAVICCGGLTTLDDLERTPDNAYRIDVNANTVGIVDKLKMSVALDKNSSAKKALQEAEEHGLITVNAGKLGQYFIDRKYIRSTYKVQFASAMYACAIAKELGSKDIYVIGMDCHTSVPNHIKYPDKKQIIPTRSMVLRCKHTWAKLCSKVPITIVTETS
jgi:hypothetical protein